MTVRVYCPKCRTALVVYNAWYRVVVHCHACGQEFLAEGVERSEKEELPAPAEPLKVWGESDLPISWERPESGKRDVLAFCPMCGELAAESSQTCPACGELLPAESAENTGGVDSSSREIRRFRREARVLAFLWILLAFLISEHDLWLGEMRLEFPAFLSIGRIMIPPIPVLTCVLIGIAAFAMVGQFWAVAAGGLLNYLILFFMVWNGNAISLVLLAGVMMLTHLTLHRAASVQWQ